MRFQNRYFILAAFLLGIFFPCTCFASNSKFKIGSAAFSPDGQYIIFSAVHKRDENIYRIRRDGSEPIQLTFSQGRDFNPVYSPDEAKIIFARVSSKQSTDADLYIMNLDGSNSVQLTSGPAHDFSPVFSPDGQTIYFIRARWYGHHSPFVSSSWHDKDLYAINVDGTNLRAITDQWYYEISRPSLSPDGKKILVYLSIHENPNSLWIIPLDNPEAMAPFRPDLTGYDVKRSEKPWAMEPLRYDDFHSPQFCPDGRCILFVWAGHYQGYFGHEIYIADLKNENTKKLTNLKTMIIDPFFQRMARK